VLKESRSADLQKIFRPVVQQILKLVRQQIKAATAEAGKNVINVWTTLFPPHPS
jgi:glutamyl-tRNA reductase